MISSNASLETRKQVVFKESTSEWKASLIGLNPSKISDAKTTENVSFSTKKIPNIKKEEEESLPRSGGGGGGGGGSSCVIIVKEEEEVTIAPKTITYMVALKDSTSGGRQTVVHSQSRKTLSKFLSNNNLSRESFDSVSTTTPLTCNRSRCTKQSSSNLSNSVTVSRSRATIPPKKSQVPVEEVVSKFDGVDPDIDCSLTSVDTTEESLSHFPQRPSASSSFETQVETPTVARVSDHGSSPQAPVRAPAATTTTVTTVLSASPRRSPSCSSKAGSGKKTGRRDDYKKSPCPRSQSIMNDYDEFQDDDDDDDGEQDNGADEAHASARRSITSGGYYISHLPSLSPRELARLHFIAHQRKAILAQRRALFGTNHVPEGASLGNPYLNQIHKDNTSSGGGDRPTLSTSDHGGCPPLAAQMAKFGSVPTTFINKERLYDLLLLDDTAGSSISSLLPPSVHLEGEEEFGDLSTLGSLTDYDDSAHHPRRCQTMTTRKPRRGDDNTTTTTLTMDVDSLDLTPGNSRHRRRQRKQSGRETDDSTFGTRETITSQGCFPSKHEKPNKKDRDGNTSKSSKNRKDNKGNSSSRREKHRPKKKRNKKEKRRIIGLDQQQGLSSSARSASRRPLLGTSHHTNPSLSTV